MSEPAGSGPEIFSLGHSNHSIEDLLRLLVDHGIRVVADVRSAPYSRWTPQFNREALVRSLAEHDIRYEFLGASLGGRSPDPAHYTNDRVDYERVGDSGPFQKGLVTLLSFVGAGKVAILCSEADPLRCHRAILIGRKLKELGVEVRHILPDSKILPQQECEDRLLHEHDLTNHDLFADADALVARAYRLQSERIAYVREREPAAQPEEGDRDR